MISADALEARSPYTSAYLDTAPDSSRLIYQLVGASQSSIITGIDRLVEHTIVLRQSEANAILGIDLNMGCSAPDIVRKGSGIAWMEKPADAAELVKKAVSHLKLDKFCLSVKLRLGKSVDSDYLFKFCHAIETAGASFITLHARIKDDPWARPAKWSQIAPLARALNIPVVVNGDLQDQTSLEAFYAVWGQSSNWGQSSIQSAKNPAGLMMGRGAITRPWIFSQISRQFVKPVQALDRLAIAKRFHQLLELRQPKDFWLSRAKRFYAYYCLSLNFGNRLSGAIGNLKDYREIENLVEAYLAKSKERFTFS